VLISGDAQCVDRAGGLLLQRISPARHLRVLQGQQREGTHLPNPAARRRLGRPHLARALATNHGDTMHRINPRPSLNIKGLTFPIPPPAGGWAVHTWHALSLPITVTTAFEFISYRGFRAIAVEKFVT